MIPNCDRTFTIFSDSKSALQAIANPSNRPGQHDAFNTVAAMLRGKPGGDSEKAKNWSIDKEMLNTVLDFAEASQKFQSRAPEGSQHPSGRKGT